MAKRPGDGAVEQGVVQINVRLNSGLYTNVCSHVNKLKADGETNVSLSSVVRDGIAKILNER